MAKKLNIARIWWRNVQPGEFYNIERVPSIKGRGGSKGGGSLYIEIPESIVTDTLDFLGATGANVDSHPVITIQAGVVGLPGLSGPIEFRWKSGGARLRIANQNRQQPNSQRHPAWTGDREFPTAPDDVGNTDEALPYFPDGGLRIYIAKTVEGEYYAGFTKGPRPAHMRLTNPMWDLYPPSTRKPVGGVINED